LFLSVKGIGKIQDSTIEMKGITVIAGENNTGKSTFGKVLYCMFNAFYESEKAIHNERAHDIRRIFSNALRRPYLLRNLKKKIIDDILTGQNLRSKIEEVLTINVINENRLDNNVINMIQESIEKSVSITDIDIQNFIVTRCFQQEFAGKINHISKPDKQGNIILTIKEKDINVNLVNDECQFFSDDVGLLHDAIYIDTPFVMDMMENSYNARFIDFHNIIGHRDDLLERLAKKKSNSTIVEEVIIKQKINKLLSVIKSVVDGEFSEDENNLLFVEQVLKKPLSLLSVSAGIKSFLIIKRLLELGEIKERGILIFDEPEIHLHPEWQIKFAEILILLQKEFNLTILLTTHSPYFLHAIDVYSDKHGIKDNLNCYLSESTSDTSRLFEVTGEIDKIYKQLARPFQKLEDDQYGN